MISIETFLEIRSCFGHFASWAVWAEEGKNPKDNIGDLTVLNPDENPTLLETVHGNSILLGLNISRRIERPFGNFHDPRPMAADFKIRYALKNTSYWGSYMTDIIKDFEEKVSGRTIRFLRSNKDFEQDNIGKLRKEIEVLGFANPVLVTFGKDAEAIAKRNLGKEFQIVRVPHYANYCLEGRISRARLRTAYRALKEQKSRTNGLRRIFDPLALLAGLALSAFALGLFRICRWSFIHKNENETLGFLYRNGVFYRRRQVAVHGYWFTSCCGHFVGSA